MSDDHYMPNVDNAHIDTGDFVEELKRRVQEVGIGLGISDRTEEFQVARRSETFQVIYNCAQSRANVTPDEPSDDAMVCRFLSPEKFLWFIDQKSIPFSSPRSFDDDLDCALHEDINDAILSNLSFLLKRNSGEASLDETPFEAWASFERSRRDDWLISCWTNLSDHKDDKLIWYKYANGQFGAGITARYGELRDVLQNRIGKYDRDGKLKCGSVNYDPKVANWLPFNKRSGFKGEKEVRFAMRDFHFRQFVAADLSDCFSELFGLRLSEDSPRHHQEALKNLWVAAGGKPERINEG